MHYLFQLSRLRWQLTSFAILLAFSASAVAQQDSSGTQPPTSTSAQTEAEIAKTLKSFRNVDDHPLFEMHFHGDYVADTPKKVSLNLPSTKTTSWACSLFISFHEDGTGLYGRNFDWDHNPALMLHTNPSDGYASISMVDISYLGFSLDDEKFKTVEGRKALLSAPLLPFDGMNEHGLTVGMAAVQETKVPFDADKPTVGCLQIIRLMLDKTKTVDEALALFAKYNIREEGAPPIHYLIADAEGHSALVELKDDKTNIIKNETNWQSATNFYLTGQDAPLQQCHRFRKIDKSMKAHQGELSIDESFELLMNIAQTSTRWSVVYDLKEKSATVAMSGDDSDRYEFSIANDQK